MRGRVKKTAAAPTGQTVRGESMAAPAVGNVAWRLRCRGFIYLAIVIDCFLKNVIGGRSPTIFAPTPSQMRFGRLPKRPLVSLTRSGVPTAAVDGVTHRLAIAGPTKSTTILNSR